MADPVWRKSRYSDNGKCLEIAHTGDTVLVRNSNHPDRTTLAFRPAAFAAFIAACSASQHDGLV